MSKSDFVVCQICQAQFKAINFLHLRKHNISVEEYVARFPNAKLTSQFTCNNRSRSLVGREITWSDKIADGVSQSWKDNRFQGRTGIPLSEESKEKLSQKLMGHSVSEEARVKIGEASIGRIPWNANLTKDSDPRLAKLADRISQLSTASDPAVRKKISDTLKKKYADGMPIPPAKGGFRADLGFYLRSRWEANYARVLNFEEIPFEYEKKRFTLYGPNKEILETYVPDFWIEIRDTFIEIKGHADSRNQWSCDCLRCQRDKRKIAAFKSQFPNIKLEIFGKEEYKGMALLYNDIVPDWEKTNRG